MKRIVLLVANLWLVTSPLHAKIVFHSDRDGNHEIYTMNLDGSNQTRLTFNGASDSYPAWSPDGKQIVFVSDRDGNDEVYVMDADGSNLRNLTHHPASDSYPDWSPDGLQIAFSSTRVNDDGSLRHNLFVMEVDGDNVNQVTGLTFAAQPKWSPDGKWILFEGIIDLRGLFDQKMEIYAIRPNGRELWRVAESKPRAWRLMGGWSPDGEQVVYTEIIDINVKASFQVIATLHPVWQKKVTKRERLPIPQMDFQSAGFSSDGKSILLTGHADPQWNIYRFRLDTHELIQLTDNMWADLAPQEWNRGLSVPAQQGRLPLYWGEIKSNRLRH